MPVIKRSFKPTPKRALFQLDGRIHGEATAKFSKLKYKRRRASLNGEGRAPRTEIPLKLRLTINHRRRCDQKEYKAHHHHGDAARGLWCAVAGLYSRYDGQ